MIVSVLEASIFDVGANVITDVDTSIGLLAVVIDTGAGVERVLVVLVDENVVLVDENVSSIALVVVV